MQYYTEYPFFDRRDHGERLLELTPEMIPALARAKTGRFLKKSLSFSNSKACSSCKKRSDMI